MLQLICMQVFEEVARKKTSFQSEDWHTTYNYLKNILNRRFDFNKVTEELFTFNEEKSEAHSELTLEKEFDKYTKLEISLIIVLNTRTNTAEIEQEGVLKTEYPEDNPFQRSIFYFFIRTVWEKLYYGKVRQQYKDAGNTLMTELMKAIMEISTE